ncbi:MAG: hypothetical protein FWG87_13920 [Defluviitaleaceae bacterium]|nr:hypothetical protein [Defluviitaleaceae bacterium]
MDKLCHLYEFATDNQIQIVNRSFSETKKAACLHLKPAKYIVLDKAAISGKAEELAILSEEVGHYETGALYVIESTYNLPVARSNRIKYEAQARNWAINNYCSPAEIERAAELEKTADSGDGHAIAERCGVTVEFLCKAVEYHRTCGVEFSFDWETIG